MPTSSLPDTRGAVALRRLLNLARGDTHQCRYVANFLLAWWNAESCGGWSLADLWAVDDAIADDMLTVAAFVAANHEYPTAYGLDGDFEALVRRWRPHLLDQSAEHEPTTDEQAGIRWWNGLTEAERGFWMRQADTAVPGAAWAHYKREVRPSLRR